jgi:hypothetical protein
MKWITRERPKIDRIACPWPIKNFVDREAEFIYVPREEVFEKAKMLNAISYDIPGAEYSYNFHDDHAQLAFGMQVYDALYSWAMYLQEETRTWTNN